MLYGSFIANEPLILPDNNMTSWSRRYKDTLHDYHPLNGNSIIENVYPIAASSTIDIADIPEIPFDTPPENLEIALEGSVPVVIGFAALSEETVPEGFDSVPEGFDSVPEALPEGFHSAPESVCEKAIDATPTPLAVMPAPWYVGGVYQGFAMARPVTAPLQQYETGVQLLKFKRYRVITRPATR